MTCCIPSVMGRNGTLICLAEIDHVTFHMHSKQALHRHLNRSRHPFFLFYHQLNQIESFQMTHQWWLISQDGKTILKVAAGVPGSIGSTSPSVSLIIVLYWTTDWLFFLDFTKKNPAVPIKDSTNRTKNATVDFEAPLIPLSDNNWRRNRQWLKSRKNRPIKIENTTSPSNTFWAISETLV